jgi:aspartyl-tRNA(Asn)/glutamyl-tRNA(Gln) amidotransferase subunit C
LSESEVENLRGDLENIVNYIKQLDELDTENVEPTYSVSENQNIWREDEIDNYGVGKEELLALAGENIEAGQVKVPKVL